MFAVMRMNAQLNVELRRSVCRQEKVGKVHSILVLAFLPCCNCTVTASTATATLRYFWPYE